MNWSRKTKVLATIGMILANCLILFGWQMMQKNGGANHTLGSSLFYFLFIMNFLFVAGVFVLPGIRAGRRD